MEITDITISPERIAELEKDNNFLCIADCFTDTNRLHNKLLNDFRTKFGIGSRMFTIILNELFKDKENIFNLKRDLESAGYSEHDVFAYECYKLEQENNSTS